MKEIIKEARSVDEAIERACEELGVERGTVEFDIISLPKRGFLGFKNTPAKVRVYTSDPEPVAENIAVAQKPIAPSQVAQSASEKKPPSQTEYKKPDVLVESPETGKSETTKKVPSIRDTESDVLCRDLHFVDMEETEGKIRKAAVYVKDILHGFGIDAHITVAKKDSGIVLRLAGEGLGVIIGRRGETLDSLQYLTSLIANREEGDYMRVTIDSGNYREKREKTLQQLAQKIAVAAVRNGRPSTLEPMNPYERRIIHAAVSRIDGVSSASVGEEPNRRVVITPTNLRPQSGGYRGNKPTYSNNRSGARTPYKSENRQETRTGTTNAAVRAPIRTDDKKLPTRPPYKASAQTRAGDSIGAPMNRGYAKELERNAPDFVKSDKCAEEKQNVASSPMREKMPDEGKDLPLYGKIDL